METIGKITVSILLIMAGMLVSIFSAYVVLQIAGLFHLQFITQFTFIQVYGCMLIVNLVKSRSKSKDESNKSIGELAYEFSAIIAGEVVGLLFVWGVAYILSQIFF